MRAIVKGLNLLAHASERGARLAWCSRTTLWVRICSSAQVCMNGPLSLSLQNVDFVISLRDFERHIIHFPHLCLIAIYYSCLSTTCNRNF